MFNNPLPRATTPTRPTAITMIDAAAASRRLPKKSILVFPSSRNIFSLLIHRRFSATSNTTREQKIAVYMLNTTPNHKITAKPFTWSVPMAYSTVATIRVVRFASTMVVVALAKPLRMAIRRAAPRASSSRIRSKTSTLASTAMPTVSTRPARPGKVNSAQTAIMIARIRMRFVSSARQATTPEKR